jgi:hypothetical protein
MKKGGGAPPTTKEVVDGLIENATILIKDEKKINNPDALWEHCELMLKKAYGFTTDCNKALSCDNADYPAILETIKCAVRLMKASLTISEKCLSGIQNPSGKVSIDYICPKCTEIQNQPGKCPKCEVVLEKQIDYILKAADKSLKEIKPTDVDSLMTTCEQLMKRASAKIKKCNSLRAEDKPITAEIAQTAKDLISLTQKSVEVAEKYISLSSMETQEPEQKPADEKPGAEKK